MTIKTRVTKLEAKRPGEPAKPKPGPYTDELHNRGLAALAEALGDVLQLEPADVAAELPAILAGIGDK